MCGDMAEMCVIKFLYSSRCFECDTVTDLEPEVIIDLFRLKFKISLDAVDNYEGRACRSGIEFTRK